MKSIAMVAVLFSILLLVAGTASAQCVTERCYDVYKWCDNYFSEEVNAYVCLFEDPEHYGYVCWDGYFLGCLDLAEFDYHRRPDSDPFNGMGGDKWLATGEIDEDVLASFYFEFKYDGVRNIRGVGYVGDPYNTRCFLEGHMQDSENCNGGMGM